MKFIVAIPVFFRLYGFHRRGGKQRLISARMAARAFDDKWNNQ